MAYREIVDRYPDHICIVCFRTVSVGESLCGKCGVPLVEISGEIEAELRTHVTKKHERVEKRRVQVVMAAALACSLLIHGALLYLGYYDGAMKAQSARSNAGGLIALYVMLTFGALALAFTYVATWLGFGLFLSESDFNSELMSVPELLMYLDLHLKRD